MSAGKKMTTFPKIGSLVIVSDRAARYPTNYAMLLYKNFESTKETQNGLDRANQVEDCEWLSLNTFIVIMSDVIDDQWIKIMTNGTIGWIHARHFESMLLQQLA